MKIMSPAYLVLDRRRSGILVMAIPVLVMMVSMLFFMPARTKERTERRHQALIALEQAAQGSGDPLPSMFEIERQRIDYEAVRNDPEMANYIFAGSFLLVLSLFAIASAWAWAFPVFNFLWGDNLKLYEKRKTRAQYVLGTIMLAVILGIIANYFTAVLGIGTH